MIDFLQKRDTFHLNLLESLLMDNRGLEQISAMVMCTIRIVDLIPFRVTEQKKAECKTERDVPFGLVLVVIFVLGKVIIKFIGFLQHLQDCKEPWSSSCDIFTLT